MMDRCSQGRTPGRRNAARPLKTPLARANLREVFSLRENNWYYTKRYMSIRKIMKIPFPVV